MEYLEWNHVIGEYFFNPSNAGKEVLLYATKKEISELGLNKFRFESELQSWQDYCDAIKCGFPETGSKDSFINKFLVVLNKWSTYERIVFEKNNRNDLKIDGVSIYSPNYKIVYPFYLGYLITLIIPLTDNVNSHNANAFFPPLNDFLITNGIVIGKTSTISEVNNAWKNLEKWSTEYYKTDFGYFTERHIGNPNWVYVGKPFSQCLLSPRNIRDIPNIFWCAGITPNSLITEDQLLQIINLYGAVQADFNERILSIVNEEDNPLRKVIIDIVKREYDKWTGEEHEIVLKDGLEKRIRVNTVVPLKLQFRLNEEGEIKFSYRVKYFTDPPPELKLDEFEDIYQNSNWSKTLQRPFQELMELRDIHNKWIAKFEFKAIRLFLHGGYYQLGNDFWIETETLSRVEDMYLLCKNDIKDSISEWCNTCCKECKDYSTLLNMPSGYSLFWFRGPQVSHNQFEQLKIYTDKKISFRDGTGLKIGPRTFLNELVPEVEIVNADGKEVVYMQYEGSATKIKLNKHQNIGNIWLLPTNLELNSAFSFELENEFIEGYKQSYRICEASCSGLSNEYLPKRNKFNAEISTEIDFIQGNKIQQTSEITATVDTQYFQSYQQSVIQQEAELIFEDNTLLKWLVGVKECDIKEFNEVYDTILNNTFQREYSDIQQRRKSAINILDHLGFVDYSYNYKNGKIYTLPPKLISIPSSNKGKRAILIGGRDEKLVNDMIKYCALSNNMISLIVKRQNEKNIQLLIPDSIILESNNEQEFSKIATHFIIEYDKWYILQLKNFIPTLEQYEKFVVDNGSSESWERFGLERKVFNKETLKFEFLEQIDKRYALTECRPSYVPEYGLWINQAYYAVDKNWGKYLFIYNYAEKVNEYGNYFAKPLEIFFNSNTIAIPGSLPLPKLFSRVLSQLSGEAPDFKELNLKGKNVRYNIYRNIPSLFTENFFRFVLKMNIEPTKQII